MDERRFRTALDTITETIRDYGEDTVITALRVILDQFNYEVIARDPGPDDDVASGNVWPHEQGPRESRPEKHGRALDLDLMARAFPGQVIDMTRRIN